jgi:hypothetical protein
MGFAHAFCCEPAKSLFRPVTKAPAAIGTLLPLVTASLKVGFRDKPT